MNSTILSLSDIATNKLIPWARNARTLLKIIRADRRGENLLESVVTGKGRQRRYQITERALKRYIATYGPAFAGRVRKTKRSSTN